MAGKKGRLIEISKERLFQVHGRFPNNSDFVNGALEFKLTSSNIEFVEVEFPGISWETPVVEELKKFKAIGIQTSALKLLSKLEPDPNFKFKTKPYDHQEKAFLLSRNLKVFGLFLEMGCGKTKISIDALVWAYQQKLIDTVLIIAPNGVHAQWVNEQFPQHNPIPDKTVTVTYYASSTAKVQKQLKSLLDIKPGSKLRVLSMNIDALSRNPGAGIRYAIDYLKTSTPDKCLIIIDESSRIKNGAATRTHSCLELVKYAEWRRILSGTPVTRGAEDLFSQMRFLDERIFGFSSFTAFKSRYCIQQTFDRYTKIVDYQHIDELQKKIDGYTLRLKKEDCLTLPPKVYIKRYVEMVPEQKKLYERLADELMVELSNGSIVAANIAIVKLLRLQQLLSGYLPNEDGTINELVPLLQNPRIIATLETLEEMQGKVIIWARFRKDIENLKIALADYKPSLYYGGMSQTEREKSLFDFTKGDSHVLIGNPQSGGIGLNLTIAKNAIYYSNSFDAECRWQSEDRAHRIGQDVPVTYVDLICKGTIDVQIVSNLRNKKSIAAMAIDQLREILNQSADVL